MVVKELLRLTDSIATTTLLMSSSLAAAVLVAKSEMRPLCRCFRLDRSWGSAGRQFLQLIGYFFSGRRGLLCFRRQRRRLVAFLVEEDDAMSALRTKEKWRRHGHPTIWSSSSSMVVVASVSWARPGMLNAAADSTGGAVLRTGAGDLVAEDVVTLLLVPSSSSPSSAAGAHEEKRERLKDFLHNRRTAEDGTGRLQLLCIWETTSAAVE